VDHDLAARADLDLAGATGRAARSRCSNSAGVLLIYQ